MSEIRIESIKEVCKLINDTLKKSPGVESFIEVEDHLRELRGQHTTLTTYFAFLEVQRAKYTADIIEQADETIWKRIKNSSTLVASYADGKNPDVARVYHKVKQLLRLLEQTSDEYRTLISYRKTELEKQI
jgi:hypothetical protein